MLNPYPSPPPQKTASSARIWPWPRRCLALRVTTATALVSPLPRVPAAAATTAPTTGRMAPPRTRPPAPMATPARPAPTARRDRRSQPLALSGMCCVFCVCVHAGVCVCVGLFVLIFVTNHLFCKTLTL
jgi:hypothetical protein